MVVPLVGFWNSTFEDLFSKPGIVNWYRVVEILAGGGIGLVEWKLETGRTHQHIATLCTTDYGPPLSWIANCKQWQYISWTEIRAHAKYLGVPLLGDDVYGGTKNMAMSLLQSKNPLIPHTQILELVDRLDRPSLHALSLGFKHPVTGENMHFSEMPPMDFAETLYQLRSIGVTLLS